MKFENYHYFLYSHNVRCFFIHPLSISLPMARYLTSARSFSFSILSLLLPLMQNPSKKASSKWVTGLKDSKWSLYPNILAPESPLSSYLTFTFHRWAIINLIYLELLALRLGTSVSIQHLPCPEHYITRMHNFVIYPKF